MNRRLFLQSATAAIAALGIDPEELIWTPKKEIVIPRRTYGEVIAFVNVEHDRYPNGSVHVQDTCQVWDETTQAPSDANTFGITYRRATVAEIQRGSVRNCICGSDTGALPQGIKI